MKRLSLLVLIFVSLCTYADDKITIVSYNVENFFYPQTDSINLDTDFTANGKYHWTYNRYKTKRDHIAKVIAALSGWETPAVIGLCEVESKECVHDLTKRLVGFNYSYIHYDSPDKRGIDVALLYNKNLFNLIESYPISIHLDSVSTTRDLLYAKGIIPSADTLHIFVCHLPSKYGSGNLSDWKRETVYNILNHKIDSIYLANSDSKICVLGDFNDSPKDNLHHATNIALKASKTIEGTYKYHGQWIWFDQFYVSHNMEEHVLIDVFRADWLLENDQRYLGQKPKRTFIGYRYNDGFSDHLPVVLTYYY